ncbi:hypothetical protein LEP1GSC038_2832 [Leptospira weilii str. 2006001855]|uniref:Uncharacterized protein n=1 Tax=Leptospira weilii str. 2006001855 TaxID=996804 RepID=M6FU28_9LEPT|nr:hypothetical protein LEP1GSC038_2832 [Leptospira weilii str. 2006001855]
MRVVANKVGKESDNVYVTEGVGSTTKSPNDNTSLPPNFKSSFFPESHLHCFGHP